MVGMPGGRVAAIRSASVNSHWFGVQHEQHFAQHLPIVHPLPVGVARHHRQHRRSRVIG